MVPCTVSHYTVDGSLGLNPGSPATQSCQRASVCTPAEWGNACLTMQQGGSDDTVHQSNQQQATTQRVRSGDVHVPSRGCTVFLGTGVCPEFFYNHCRHRFSAAWAAW